MLTMYKIISWLIFLSSYVTGTIYFFKYNNPEFVNLGLLSVFSYFLGVILLLKIEKLTKLSNNIFILTLTFTISILFLISIVWVIYTLFQGFVINDYYLITFLLSLLLISYFGFKKYLFLLNMEVKNENF